MVTKGVQVVDKGTARLRIFKGLKDAKLGITADMEVGHLYHFKNDSDELAALGRIIGLNPSWMKNRDKGLAHYDLWGAPLEKAKRLFKVVTRGEVESDITRIGEEIREGLSEIEKEARDEREENDDIVKNMGYISFASKSKGRSRGRGKPRGKRRLRRVWKDVELYRYAGGGWHTERFARLDERVTEITKLRVGLERMDMEDLKSYVKQHCNQKGGAGGFH